MTIEPSNARLRVSGRPQDLRPRLGALVVVLVSILAMLLGRLWVLQVVRGAEFAEQAEKNHLKEREIPAPRGSIYDADGQRIAEVRASFDVVVTPDAVDEASDLSSPGSPQALGGPPDRDYWELPSRIDIGTLSVRLAELLDEGTAEELLERYVAGRRGDRWRNVVLASDVSDGELERVLARRAWLPGVSVVSRHRRHYPDGSIFSHLVGYLREVRADELPKLRERYRHSSHGPHWYEPGDVMGKYGVEAAHEEWLRGDDGSYWVQVDVHGRELGRSTAPEHPGDEYFRSIDHFLDRGLSPEESGHDLHLTVRRDLQQLAVDLLGAESGSVVMLEVNSGRVLALANAPGFDPTIFNERISPEEWKRLSQDPAHPLVDKALQGVYPPASTWKMIVAAAALESKTWTRKTAVTCKGGFKIGRRYFRCWNRRGHGRVNLRKALSGSCDVYFYRAGLAVGIDTVAHYARMFGMGSPTGIGFNSEASGLNPDSAWKKKRFRSRPKLGVWKKGDTASAVIGQGYTLATPLQLASMTASLANGGTVYRPLVVDRVVGTDGEVVWRQDPEVTGQVDLAPEHFEAIRDGMFAVVEDRGGTARAQRLKSLAFAGKTGTAQVVRLGALKRKKNASDKRFKDHAWFTAFAPYENPEVAITVLVEHGEHGSTAAAPIARKMFEHYFQGRIEDARAAKSRVGDSRKRLPQAKPSRLQAPRDEPIGGR